MTTPHLHRTLSVVEYFAFGFGTMVGVGWLVLIDDWLGRGGPGGAVLGFLVGGLALLPVAHTYGRLVREVPDAGAEVAYAEGVFPANVSFAAGWMMVLAYAIVCPWEAVAIGNLLARVFPDLNTIPLYAVAGKTIYAPRVVAGLLLTGLITGVNYRGIRRAALSRTSPPSGSLRSSWGSPRWASLAATWPTHSRSSRSPAAPARGSRSCWCCRWCPTS